jgi:hypothetical protein
MPEKLTDAPRSRPRRHALGVEDVERVVPRLPRVDHQREIQPPGHRDLGCERVALDVPRRVVVVVVEPALADGDRALRAVEQVGDGLDTGAGVVGVQPDGGVDRDVPGGDVQALQRGGPVAAHGDHRRHALGSRVGHDLVGRVGRDVAVRVEPAHRHVLMRGNSGAALVTGRPPG